jgi:tRNA-splicing ligase RtcB
MPDTITTCEGTGVIKHWTRGVKYDINAHQQSLHVANLPFVHPHVAIMPDVHLGYGATIGSVIPTDRAIIPAAVGVDIGCGMMAIQTTLTASDLPDNLHAIRSSIEAAIPHGRTNHGKPGDKGSWDTAPPVAQEAWAEMGQHYNNIVARHPKAFSRRTADHMGTLGTGNHFIEICLDEDDAVWAMLHSGSRGPGNRIGMYFTELAKKEMRRFFINLPDTDLAYLVEGTEHFADYVDALQWAQTFATANREAMMRAVLRQLSASKDIPYFVLENSAVNCHHNYVSKERHFGNDVWITRKGAVSARKDELGIIPGSMGAKSYIVKGKGNRDSYHSCSHGAGRRMSRRKARETFSIDDHGKATAGIECRKDIDVIDETPAAYKPIEAVMAAQDDLVEIVHTLRQVVCVKG